MGQQVAAGHEFGDVDRTGQPAAFVRYLDERGALEFFQRLERQMADRLGVRAGGRYLDVGCGTGDDARGLAGLVGPGGEVVGVDSSAAMVTEAETRTAGSGLPVAFRRGDAHLLEFADGTFDGCRVRRVLTHLADPQRAVAEMARVTRPGGRVVAYEADWETFVLDAADRAVTRAVVQLRCDRIRNGWMGRQLPRLFKRAGLAEVAVEPLASTQTDHARAMALFELDIYAQRAQEAGLVTAAAAAAWLAQLAQAGEEGTFLAGVTGFLVSGHRS